MLRLSTLVILLLWTNIGYSQIFKTYKPYPTPSVIMIKLPTYSKRIKVYENAKNLKSAEQLKKDAKNIQTLLIADFKNHFTFCDFYFYYDTVSEAIAERKFVGNLFDKDMKPITTSPVAEDDTTYQLVHYGYYVSEQTEVTSNPKKLKSREDTYYTGTGRLRLVALNYKFGRLPDPVPNGTYYSPSPTFYPNKRKKNRVKNATVYKSKKFDLYYGPAANNLSYEMDRYYRQHRVN